MRITWLPDVLRAAGLTVHTYSGWTSRGSSSWGPVRGVICHATAGSRTSTDEGEMRVLWVTGSTSAPVPISQLYLSRSGEWTVGASGRCNHVLVGDKGPHEGFGNSHLIGVEAQNDNRGEPWNARMLESYQRGVAAILKHLNLPASRAVAHAEHQNGKSDPLGINMTTFRQRVAAYIEGEDDVDLTDKVTMTDGDGNRWSYGEVARADDTTVNGALGAARGAFYYLHWNAIPALARMEAQLKVIAGQDAATAVREEIAKLTATLAAVVAEAVPEANQDTVEAALRSVLGELDNPA